MNKFIFVIGLMMTFGLSGQSNIESIENWCGTSQRMNTLMQDPSYQLIHAQDEAIKANELLNPTPSQKSIYKIPIVFHIIHNGGSENISEAQIFNALDVINRDFRKQNEDTAEVVSQFKSLIADVEIEFVLATKDPVGNCFKGYTRTQSTTTFSGGWSADAAQISAVRNLNDVYNGNWPSNKYLNVYVVADAGGAGGYTQYPSNNNFGDMENGIWILHTQFGEIGTSSTSAGRSLTHEIGHWLDLPHTWGNSNSPGPGEGNCGTDDGVSDTPLCEGASGGCPLSQVSCGSLDNVQNYMDYALSCQSMFTLGQADRMRTAAESSIGGRNNLWKSANLIATGATGTLELCKAEFSVNKTSICAGTQVQFTDETFNDANGWTWTFNGGVPATSNAQNPTVVYNTPGYYSVTLVATDGSSSDTEVKTEFIHVVPAAETLPILEGFESYSTLNNIEEWSIFNPSGNGFELVSVGLNSNKSVRIRNFGEQDGFIDELISSPIDLSGESQITLSFRYAHKRRNINDGDILKLYITKDCGDTWSIRKTIQLSLSSSVQSTTFTPSSVNDWTTVHVTNITSSFFIDNFRYKFLFESGGGNNLYLDNINIYAGGPSDELVESAADLNEVNSINGLTIYPNPVDQELTVDFFASSAQPVIITVQDVSGKIVEQHKINANEGSNLVLMNTEGLSSGVYFIELKTESSKQVKQIIVK